MEFLRKLVKNELPLASWEAERHLICSLLPNYFGVLYRGKLLAFLFL